MTASRQTKKAWGSKLEKLEELAKRAQEDLLVGIYQSRQAGLSQEDVAYNLESCSASGVKAKEEKGKAILAARKGSREVASTP